jgi:hypothetical protein
MTTHYPTSSPMPMKGLLTTPGFAAECVVSSSPTGGWLIYDPSPAPPNGAYTLTFADEEISAVRVQCSHGVCRVTDS